MTLFAKTQELTSHHLHKSWRLHPSRLPDSNISVTCVLLANHPERAHRQQHIPPQHYTAKETSRRTVALASIFLQKSYKRNDYCPVSVRPAQSCLTLRPWRPVCPSLCSHHLRLRLHHPWHGFWGWRTS
jgi:hypothetical protein